MRKALEEINGRGYSTPKFSSIGGVELTEEELSAPRRDYGPVGSKPIKNSFGNSEPNVHVSSWLCTIVDKDAELHEMKDLQGPAASSKSPLMIKAACQNHSTGQARGISSNARIDKELFLKKIWKVEDEPLGPQKIDSLAPGAGRPKPRVATASFFGNAPDIWKPSAPSPVSYDNSSKIQWPEYLKPTGLQVSEPCTGPNVAKSQSSFHIWTPRPRTFSCELPASYGNGSRARYFSFSGQSTDEVDNEASATSSLKSNDSSGYATGGEPSHVFTGGRTKNTNEEDMKEFASRYGYVGQLKPLHMYRRRKGKYFKDFNLSTSSGSNNL